MADRKKFTASAFLLVGLCCIWWEASCTHNTTQDGQDFSQDPYLNQGGFASWTPESIKETFPLVEKRTTFIVRSHSNHLPRLNFGCQMKGCHPNAEKGREAEDIPPMPESCYDCHERESKLPHPIPQ